MPAPTWRAMASADLPRVQAIADAVHPDFPEAAAIPAERLALCPAGCLVLATGAQLLGYAVSHPWHAGQAPRLNSLLGGLPAAPGTWYLHDLALLPAARGGGAAAAAVRLLVAQAQAAGLADMSLVAVNGSAGFWQRQGFRPAVGPDLASYGGAAQFMQRAV